MTPTDDGTPLPSSTGDKPPDAFGEQRIAGEGRSVNRWSYLRWGVWILLLAGAVGLLVLNYFQPGFSDSLAQWIAQLQQASLSQSQRDAELAAAEALRAAGALVIEEGPQQGVTSVHFTTPKTLSEDSLAQLALLVRLNSLNLTGTPITDAQLAYVAKARTLASLVLMKRRLPTGAWSTWPRWSNWKCSIYEKPPLRTLGWPIWRPYAISKSWTSQKPRLPTKDWPT